jgi:hypothetical protein
MTTKLTSLISTLRISVLCELFRDPTILPLQRAFSLQLHNVKLIERSQSSYGYRRPPKQFEIECL